MRHRNHLELSHLVELETRKKLWRKNQTDNCMIFRFGWVKAERMQHRSNDRTSKWWNDASRRDREALHSSLITLARSREQIYCVSLIVNKMYGLFLDLMRCARDIASDFVGFPSRLPVNRNIKYSFFPRFHWPISYSTNYASHIPFFWASFSGELATLRLAAIINFTLNIAWTCQSHEKT